MAQVQLSRGPIRYRDVGSGPALLFVHGMFTNGDLWRNVSARLASGYRCIAPDWPLGGHRLPMRADADLSVPALARLVVEFADALELDDVTLVGGDTGGSLSQVAIAQAPHRFRRLVLLSSGAYRSFPPPTVAHLALIAFVPGAAWLAGLLLGSPRIRRSPLAFGWAMKTDPPRDVWDSYLRPLRSAAIRRDLVKVMRGVRPGHTRAAARRFHRYDRPVLIAWSVEDRLFPPRLGARLARDFPDARLVWIDDAYTFSPEDRPDAVAEALRTFLDDTQPPERNDA